MSTLTRERKREQWEKDNVEEARDSSVEEVEDALPHYPPPIHYTVQEKEAWVETVAFVRLCRKEGNKLLVTNPGYLECKWSTDQKTVSTFIRHNLVGRS